MHGRVLQRSNEPQFLRMKYAELYQIWGSFFRFQIRCSASTERGLKGNLGRKSRPNFGLFASVKFRIGIGWATGLNQFSSLA